MSEEHMVRLLQQASCTDTPPALTVEIFDGLPNNTAVDLFRASGGRTVDETVRGQEARLRINCRILVEKVLKSHVSAEAAFDDELCFSTTTVSVYSATVLFTVVGKHWIFRAQKIRLFRLFRPEASAHGRVAALPLGREWQFTTTEVETSFGQEGRIGDAVLRLMDTFGRRAEAQLGQFRARGRQFAGAEAVAPLLCLEKLQNLTPPSELCHLASHLPLPAVSLPVKNDTGRLTLRKLCNVVSKQGGGCGGSGGGGGGGGGVFATPVCSWTGRVEGVDGVSVWWLGKSTISSTCVLSRSLQCRSVAFWEIFFNRRSNSNSWPRKLKLGDMDGRLSFTYLQQIERLIVIVENRTLSDH
ncbi:hypothetical protein T10_11781 [Trichinella papuae]|uniref:Uncharacterized protein n=1 Tax=Trichinella papuae TaxID=268474 RepID=A0A0V1N4N5_9BILA|nr:hypothetical protein T10_11781 [Trichinella papuae]